MNNSFKLAPLANNEEVLQYISKYENDLKTKTGKDIVLIAYAKENA